MRTTISLLLVAAGMTAGLLPANAAYYQRGAFYYGSDCGGNPVAGLAGGTAAKSRGVIVGADVLIDKQMNCDDRRYAIGPYRDGLEGQLGQAHAWFNPEGGGSGSFTPVRSYTRDGYVCRDFRESYDVSGKSLSDFGSACVQEDGNWHIL